VVAPTLGLGRPPTPLTPPRPSLHPATKSDYGLKGPSTDAPNEGSETRPQLAGRPWSEWLGASRAAGSEAACARRSTLTRAQSTREAPGSPVRRVAVPARATSVREHERTLDWFRRGSSSASGLGSSRTCVNQIAHRSLSFGLGDDRAARIPCVVVTTLTSRGAASRSGSPVEGSLRWPLTSPLMSG
jgi:hypothetical protein